MLPTSYISLDQYFADATTFLEEHQWIYDFRVTHFLVERVWERAPEGWLSALEALTMEEVNKLPFGELPSRLPKGLKNFVETSRSLAFDRRSEIGVVEKLRPGLVARKYDKGMSAKKLHEVEMMSSFIESVCVEQECDVIIDVGCGLGYLDVVLCDEFSFKVIGIELQESNAKGANRRAEKILGKIPEKLGYIAASVGDDVKTVELISDIQERSGGGRVCVVGLHCCGDLAPNVLRLFRKLPATVKACVCLGCCYHKMMEPNVAGTWNFPMSESLGSKCSSFDISKYGLRLACQQTPEQWTAQSEDDHRLHTKFVGFRAVVQLFLHERNLSSSKKCTRKHDLTDFTSYSQSFLKKLGCADLAADHALEIMEKRYEENVKHFVKIEAVTALQVILQPVLETLILVDRCAFLQESDGGGELCDVRVLPVFDPIISPRNLAVVAHRL